MINNRYEPKGKIGFGAFGQTFKAFDHQSEEFVAVKLIPHKNEVNKSLIKREVSVLKHLSLPDCHPNLLCFKDVIVKDEYTVIVTDYFDSYTLQHLTDKSALGAFSEKRDPQQLYSFFKLVSDLTLALDQFHKKGMAHRDIKPDNVLISKNKIALKLIDYGLSCLTNTFNTNDQDLYCSDDIIETIFYRYSSPELIILKMFAPKDLETIDFDKIYIASDMWSLGILLFYITHQRLPFDKKTNPRQLWFKIINGEIEKSNCGYKIIDNLINNKLLKINPENRISSEDLYKFAQRNMRRLKQGNKCDECEENFESLFKTQLELEIFETVPEGYSSIADDDDKENLNYIQPGELELEQKVDGYGVIGQDGYAFMEKQVNV